MLTAIAGFVAPLIVPTIGTAIAGLLTWGIHRGLGVLRQKLGSEHFSNVIDVVDKFAAQAVLATEQTVVDSMKQTGKWGSQESYDAALKAALASLKVSSLGALPELSKAGITDVDAYLQQLIEAKVKEVTWSQAPKG